MAKHFTSGHSACKNVNATQISNVSSNISVPSQAPSAEKHSNSSNSDAEGEVKAPDDNCLGNISWEYGKIYTRKVLLKLIAENYFSGFYMEN